MLRVMTACLAVGILGGCWAGTEPTPRPQAAAQSPGLGQVPVGASLASGQPQEIYLVRLTESRPIANGLWAAGNGYARVNGGSALFSWKSTTPSLVELELPTGSCASLLKSRSIPDGLAFRIVGKGHFQSFQVSGDYVGKFVLDSVASCDSVADE